MQGMDGLKTAMRIKEKYPKLPVVLVTAYIDVYKRQNLSYAATTSRTPRPHTLLITSITSAPVRAWRR